MSSHQDGVEDKWREQKAAVEEAAEQEVDEQGKPLTKKQRQQLKRAAEKERAKQRQATQDRMEPQVWILPAFLRLNLALSLSPLSAPPPVPVQQASCLYASPQGLLLLTLTDSRILEDLLT